VIRVGFVCNFDGHRWLGGLSYFRNLFRALFELPGRRVEPVIITRRDTSMKSLSVFGAVEILRTSLVEVERPWWRMRRGLQLYLGRDWLFERFLYRHRIDVLSHSGHLGRRCPLPTLSWIPDFQEHHLPKFFSEQELLARRRQLEESCRHGTALLLSSYAALRDLEEIKPACATRAHVLQFVASVPDFGTLPSLVELEHRYGFKGPYFHLPNQFWVHKNHQLVIDALARLRNQGTEVLVLATGVTSDHRQPGHFASLMKKITEAGLLKQFRILGVVPFEDLMGLMARSVAVLNPSLSEGWSTTVEEAKSLGRQVLLSDIAVHREQSPERAVYFDPHDVTALTQHIARLLDENDVSREESRIRAALERLPLRRQRFAIALENILVDLCPHAAKAHSGSARLEQ